MSLQSRFVVELRKVDKDDTLYVGGKNANLGEMIQAGFPVPDGFAVTAHSYFTFLRENGLDTKISHLLNGINYEDSDALNKASRQIKKLIVSSKIPQGIIDQIFAEYKKICGKKEDILVAIRSSATSEDSKDASFAGQNETFLNISGDSSVIVSIRDAWASLFESRSMYYRNENKIDHLTTGIAVVVQKMVESESSGILFTIDPVTNNPNRIVIESIFGLGEYIVQGKVTPDHYEVDKSTYTIVDKKIARQPIMLTKSGKKNSEVKLSVSIGEKQKIKDTEIVALAHLGKRLEEHYNFPQDIEWAKEDDRLYIVQTRPITTTEKAHKNSSVNQREEFMEAMARSHSTIKDAGKPILIGDPASPGFGIGTVRVLSSPKDIGKVRPGDVLVAPYTNPDYVPAMKRAAAIVTEKGGRTSHAAIVSREFGIPAVVGTPRATSLLKDGMVITVNGTSGEIFKGSVRVLDITDSTSHFNVKTHTKLYVNLAEPELAGKIAALPVDGVGLLRAEFMIAQIGIHPKKMIHEGKGYLFTEKLSQGLEEFCKSFYPRPVLYRATDFKTNEYRNLVGGKAYEPEEPNPMLGYRGAYRYIHDSHVFDLELKAIRYVREKRGLNNLNLMVPFVRTVEELSTVKHIITKSGLKRGPNFKLFMMCEIPSNVILIEDFIRVGIDGVSIGSNDLTMLMLGTDRDNEMVSSEFDERNEAVKWALERVIRACRKNNIAVSICGQAPSVYPSLVKDLVEWGVTSVSVSPDAVENTRWTIHKAESDILNK